jgi:hypothetical protein
MSYGVGKNARQGKIARLSDALREELNLRILDGENGRTILHWLNGHEEVKRKVPTDDEGLHVTDANLSNWRKGGYEEWRTRRERLARTKDLAQFSVKLAGASAGNLTKGAAAILSGRILEILETLDRLTETAGDGVAPPVDPVLLAATTESLASLAESLASLRAGDQNDRRIEQYDERTALLTRKIEQAEQALKLAKRDFQRKYMAQFPKWYEDARVKDILAGPESTDAKTELLGQHIFGEDWK